MLAEIIYCAINKCLQSLIALSFCLKWRTDSAVNDKTIGLFYCLAPADGRYQGFALIGKNRVQMRA